MSRAQSNFKAAEQLRQGNFHDTSLTISDSARGGGSPNRLLLAPGYSSENLYPGIRSTAVQFFNQRRIHWWSSKRCGDNPNETLPTHHLMSSQVACVNFLLPLAAHPAAVLALLKKIDPEVDAVLPTSYEKFNSLVEFEWTGLGSSLEGTKATRGAMATSADAFVLGSVKARRRAFIFEWKYIESYSASGTIGKGSNETRLKRYREKFSD